MREIALKKLMIGAMLIAQAALLVANGDGQRRYHKKREDSETAWENRRRHKGEHHGRGHAYGHRKKEGKRKHDESERKAWKDVRKNQWNYGMELQKKYPNRNARQQKWNEYRSKFNQLRRKSKSWKDIAKQEPALRAGEATAPLSSAMQKAQNKYLNALAAFDEAMFAEDFLAAQATIDAARKIANIDQDKIARWQTILNNAVPSAPAEEGMTEQARQEKYKQALSDMAKLEEDDVPPPPPAEEEGAEGELEAPAEQESEESGLEELI